MTAPGVELRPGRRWGVALCLALPWLLVLLLAGLQMLRASRIGPIDDAFITYRSARNLAEGLGPVFNPGEQVLSVTTPGYMLLLAALSPLSQDFVALGLTLNALGLLALGALVIDLSAGGWRTGANGQLAAAARCVAALVAVALTLSFWPLKVAIGMETPLYAAALLAVFSAYRRALAATQQETKWLLWTATAAAIAFLIRPDGALAGLVVGTHWLFTRRRVPWSALALALLLSLPWVIFAWAYYGSPLPNTLTAKVTHGLVGSADSWGAQLAAWAGQWLRLQPLAAALLLVGLAAALLGRPKHAAGLVVVRRLMLAWAALYIASYIWLDVGSYAWYYVPLAPVAALLAGDGAALLVQRMAHWAGQRRSMQTVAALATAALLLIVLLPASREAAVLAAPVSPRSRELAYRQTGIALRALCDQPGNEPVGMAEIGVLGYTNQCRIVDFSGLLQPELAVLQLDLAGKIEWAIKSYALPTVVLAGDAGYPDFIARQPWFSQRYDVADHQEVAGFRSLVFRRSAGIAGQHDLGTAVWWRENEGRTVTTSLPFPATAGAPIITLHAFLPPGSSLAVEANGQLVAELVGQQAAWIDYPLLLPATIETPVTLTLTGRAEQQPAAVAWIATAAPAQSEGTTP